MPIHYCLFDHVENYLFADNNLLRREKHVHPKADVKKSPERHDLKNLENLLRTPPIAGALGRHFCLFWPEI